MQLSKEESTLVGELNQLMGYQRGVDDDNRRHFDGTAKVKHMGISLPPEAELFAFYPNWIRAFVNIVEERMDVRLLVRDNVTDEDPGLRETWKRNQLDTHSHRFHTDLLVYGRAVLTVSRGVADGKARIVVEDPRSFAIKSDPVTGETLAALRTYEDFNPVTGRLGTHYALYTPDEIVIVRDDLGKREQVQRVKHGLGRVPVVVARLTMDSGEKTGQPLAKDLYPIVDLAGRTMSNLQMAMETNGIPQKIAAGVSEDDFRGPDGKINPDKWATYFGSIWTMEDKDGKVFQLEGADLTQFTKIIEMLTNQAAGLTGLSPRQLGQSTVNPASEGALRAEEARLVKKVERVNTAAGAAWAWALGIAVRIEEGVWEDGTIAVVWQNPATPTESQQADRMQKLTGGKPVLSVRGAIQEMPWSQERKMQELQWIKEELEAELGHLAISSKVDPYDDADAA